MVSESIRPFVIPVTIMAPKSGGRGVFEAPIDLGCTSCLLSLSATTNLGIRARKLAKAMRFKQMDGSVLGGGVPGHPDYGAVEARDGPTVGNDSLYHCT